MIEAVPHELLRLRCIITIVDIHEFSIDIQWNITDMEVVHQKLLLSLDINA